MSEALEAASAIADTIDEWNAASHDALLNDDVEEAHTDSRYAVPLHLALLTQLARGR